MSFITFGLGGSASDLLRLGFGSSVVVFDPAQVWTYVLSNGKTAGQNLVENNTMLLALTASPGGWGALIEGAYTAADLLRLIAAVAAGKTRITDTGEGTAHVEFDAVDASDVRVSAEMTGSERVSTTLTP